jgi:hypothetical protein
MKRLTDIEKLIDKIDIVPGAEMDKRTLGDALTAHHESRKQQRPEVQPRIWRITMKSRITRLAAAAVIVIVAVIIINQFGGSINGTSSAFAAMERSMERMKTMHQVYWTDYGEGQKHRSETWYDFTSRTVIAKYSRDGKVFKISSLNYDTMKNMVYVPESNAVEIVYRCDVNPRAYPDSAVEVVDDYLKRFEFRGGEVSHQRGVYDGEDVDVFEVTTEGNERRNRERVKLVVNRETHLPIVCETRAVTPEGALALEQELSFDFLTDMPKDVYEVGVPRSSKVIVDSVSVERYKRKVALSERISKLEPAFNEVYRLEEAEVLVLITPNDMPPRLQFEQIEREIRALEDEQYLERIAKQQRSKRSNDAVEIGVRKPTYKQAEVKFTAYEWSDGINRHASRPLFSGGTSVREVLERIIGLSISEYDIPESVLNVSVTGDWILRKAAPADRLLSAFEKILRRRTGRAIHFVKTEHEREVIVARGKFEFKPLSGTYDDSWIHVFSDTLDADERGGGSSNRSVDRFIRQRLATHLDRQVVNLAGGCDAVHNFGTHMSSYLKKIPDGPERDAKLTQLLENLSRQTSLTFTKERRAVDVWHIEEDGALTTR